MLRTHDGAECASRRLRLRRLRTGGAMSMAPPFPCCWVEQVAEAPDSGVLFSRLHQRGEVLGRGTDVLYVRFTGEGQLISVSPQLVRVLDTAPGGG